MNQKLFFGIPFFVAFLLLSTGFISTIKAQDRAGSGSDVGFGVSAVYSNTLEDADYEDSSGNGEIDKFELFLDIGSIRIAANAVHGLNKTSNPNTILTSNTTYLAYRYQAYESRSRLDAYLMGGIARVTSYIRVDNKAIDTSDEYGYVLGTGILYYFSDNLGLGCQLLRISAKGELNDESVNTGSDQVQLVFKYPF